MGNNRGYLAKGVGLTNLLLLDLDSIFVYVEQVLDLLVLLMPNGVKNKSGGLWFSWLFLC